MVGCGTAEAYVIPVASRQQENGKFPKQILSRYAIGQCFPGDGKVIERSQTGHIQVSLLISSCLPKSTTIKEPLISERNCDPFVARSHIFLAKLSAINLASRPRPLHKQRPPPNWCQKDGLSSELRVPSSGQSLRSTILFSARHSVSQAFLKTLSRAPMLDTFRWTSPAMSRCQ